MPREQWTSRKSFILAGIGGAVGMGNIWRFSYVAGENGGAVFLFLYFAFVLVLAIPLVIAELSIGRRAQGDAVAAFEIERDPGRWRWVGWLGIVVASVLLSYYAVITGWALKYFVGAATGAMWRAAGSDFGGYFRGFISDRGGPLAWQAAALALATFIAAAGVRDGIERVNRMVVPVLAVIVVVLAGFSLALPGAHAGVSFLFDADWAALRQPGIYLAALGQAFFSVGVGAAFFVTYGSYVPRSFFLPACAAIIAGGDAVFAVVAGLAIFPAVFALGGNPAEGPELAFVTLPQVFLEMPAGEVIGAVFFLLLFFAATTSIVSLLSIPVAAVTQRLRLRHWQATVALGGVLFLLGVPSALSYGVLASVKIGSLAILDAIDHCVSNVLMPIVGIATALYVGWRLDRRVALSESDFGDSRAGRIWLWLVRVLVPTAILGIFVQSTGGL